MTAGQTLAQFEILEPLAEGEFGPAYKARDGVSGREVALEILPSARGSLDLDRLRQEVKASSALEHWNIAKVYDLAHAGDVNFLVREHVEGKTLAAAAPSPGDTLECARQIAGALAAAHAIGITHRHLNPGNVILAAQNTPKLINFGLTPARRAEAYLAPEQLDGRGADARADIFAFGKLLAALPAPSASVPLAHVISRATRKDPARRFQLMADVQQALEKIADPTAHAAERGHRLLQVTAAAVVAIAVLGWWMFGGRGGANLGPARITSDNGLTTEGAISADGRSVAYASDRDSAGVLHLWVQPLSGGAPKRITDGTEDDHDPAFAPDGSRIVFRSEREGGGLYSVAAAGGAPQLLVKEGRDPRYSPDGRWISYWTGNPLQPSDAAIWTIASHGGAPIRIHSEFPDARYPIWSPDGKHLLFVAHTGERFRSRSGDWYVTTIENGSSRGHAGRTGADTLLHLQNVRESSDGYYSGTFVIPEAWTPGQVLFSGRMGPVPLNKSLPHLLRIPLSNSIFQTTGAAHEITSATNWDALPSVAPNGQGVFTRRQLKPQIWSVAANGSGDPRRATRDEGEVRFSVSANGRKLAYRFPLPEGRHEFRVVDLDTGRQEVSIRQPDGPREGLPVLSADGGELAYNARGIFRVSLPDGRPERIGRNGSDRISSWSADGKRMLLQRGWGGVSLLNTENGDDRDFLRDDNAPVLEARFSPDGKWVAFTLAVRPHPQIFIVSAAEPHERIAVTEEDVSAGSPAWSPNGNQIYYLTQCQGFRCIWARRLDARSKHPQGDPFAIRHFHHARYSLLSGIDPQNVGLAVAGDKLVFGMFETTGNIWSLPALPRP